MKKFWIILLTLAAGAFVTGCVTQKKKGQEAGWLKRGYHSLTSKYNYWFNADELFRLTTTRLEEQHQDNYSQVLDIYPYMAIDPQSAKGDLDNVVKKASSGIALHRPGDWVDDCYTLIGQAQFVKQDFETAESTFRWIKDEHNPNKKIKKNKTAVAKNKKKIAKQKKKVVEAKKKKKANTVKQKKKTLEEKRQAAAKKKKVAAKNKKAAAKNKKKGQGKTTPKQPATPAPATTAPTKTTPMPTAKPDAAAAAAPAPKAAVLLGSNPYKRGLRHTAAYPLAMVWYARTLTAREKYEEAEFVIRDLYDDPFFPSNLLDDLAAAEANLWIKQKKYDQALKPLAKAVEVTTKKKDRARYAFILAQLYDRAGQYEKAFAAYEAVLRSNPVYEMEFNARLHQVQAGWSNGQMSSAEANRTLDKMGKDDKNLDYRDQIYYTMAEIALKDGLKKDAIAYLRQSLSASKGNASQRAESYLKLADLYFEAEDFVQAKNYYDSTATVLVTTDPRHKRATDYAANLTDIARLITTINANDSIVRVYRMSNAERKELAKSIRKQQQQDAEAAAAAARVAAAIKAQPGATKGILPTAGAKNTSTFYFYNEAYVKKGKKDFTKVWGDRKLEDDWRRLAHQQSNENEEVVSTDSLGNNTVTDNELNSIFKNLPKSEEELAGINATTYEALYTLGTLFRDKLQNYRRSAASLEEEQSRYPAMDKFEKETWYYAYLDHTDLNNPPRAKYYYDKLTGKYPNSSYARSLSDPNFLKATKSKEREVTTYYDSTFTIFKTGQYQLAYQRCNDAPRKYGSQNPLMAKFALLSALCVGNLQGSDAYCQALSEVIGRYPESVESTRAKEIARLLGCKGFEVLETPKNKAEIDDAFTREDDKLHYFIVALTGNDVRLDDVKGAVADYNREFHKTEQLRISNIFLGTNTDAPIIVIRKFDTRDQAMRFYREVKDRKGFLGETDKKTYKKEYFAITQENYRRVLKNKTLDGYRGFFETNYLK